MKVNLNSPKLNIFNYYRSSERWEVSTTRALTLALTESGPGAPLLQCFLSLVMKNLKHSVVLSGDEQLIMDYLKTWPYEVDVSLEQNVADIQSSPLGGILVCLVPELRLDGARSESREPLLSESTEPAGRADVVQYHIGSFGGDEDNNSFFTMILESKLTSYPTAEQMAQYISRFNNVDRSDKFISAIVCVSWEGVHAAIRNEYYNDPRFPFAVRDFLAFMEERPELTLFYGLRKADLSEQEANISSQLQWNHFYNLAAELHRDLNRRLKEKYLSNEEHEYLMELDHKRGEMDVDFRASTPSGTTGNTGIAWWDYQNISTKLVIGAKSRYEMDMLLYCCNKSDNEARTAFTSRLHGIIEVTKGDHSSLEFSVRVRLYWNRFQEDWIEVYKMNLHQDNIEIEELFSQAMSYISEFHGQGKLDHQKIGRLLHILDENKNLLDQEEYDRSRNKLENLPNPDSGMPKTFMYMLVNCGHSPDWFENTYDSALNNPGEKQVANLVEELAAMQAVLAVVK